MGKILLSLSDDFQKDIDDYCEKYRYERSEFIRETLRRRLYANPQATPPKTEIPPLENSGKKMEEEANVVEPLDPYDEPPVIREDVAKVPKRMAYCEVKGFFQYHPRGQMYHLTDISFDDANGNTLFKGGACAGCIEQFRNQMKKEGTLYIEGERQ